MILRFEVEKVKYFRFELEGLDAKRREISCF